MGAWGRFKSWGLRWLVALDQLVCVWLLGWPYVWANRCAIPDPDETISSYVGRHAVLEQEWALIAERVINFIMRNPRTNNHPGHCRECIGS